MGTPGGGVATHSLGSTRIPRALPARKSGRNSKPRWGRGFEVRVWSCGSTPAHRVSGSRLGPHREQRPSPTSRLENSEAVLSRSDLRELGYERRAVDAIFRGCPVIAIPGYTRPLIRVAEFLAYLEQHTHRDDRVRSCWRSGVVR